MTKAKRRGGGRSRSTRASESQSSAARYCESCGAALAPKAKFCHRCGAPLGAAPAVVRKRSRRNSILVYAIAVVSVVGTTLAAAIFTTLHFGAQAPPAPDNRASTTASTVDLSTMTPRQAADRLFNRVMSASERGDAEEAGRFAPMAIAAYERVATLDADARYHLGLLNLVLGDLDGTREQIDILKQMAPRHLLAVVLEHDIATQTGDAAAAARSAAAFLAAYDEEMAAAPRPEYEAHRTSIDRLRAAAVAESDTARSDEAAAADDGAALFQRNCAECHGPAASGTDKGPPLVHQIYEPGHHSDDAFYRAVRLGARAHHWPFGDMPPVEGVSDEQVAAIVAYVRGLQRAAGIR